MLAQPGDRYGERRTGVRLAVGGGEAGAGQGAFGALHKGQLPGPVPVEQGEQFGGGGGVGEVMGGAGGERPRPPHGFVADFQGADVAENGTGLAERGGGLGTRRAAGAGHGLAGLTVPRRDRTRPGELTSHHLGKRAWHHISSSISVMRSMPNRRSGPDVSALP